MRAPAATRWPRALGLAAALALAGPGRAQVAGVARGLLPFQVRQQGHFRVGVEDVDLTRERLGFDRLGNLGNRQVREGGLQNRTQGSYTVIGEWDLPGGTWILDTENRVDLDLVSDLQVTSERYDRISGMTRTTLARPLAHDAFLAFELHGATYFEQHLPNLEASVGGLDVVYERELKGDAYLHARGGVRRGTIMGSDATVNNPGDDFDELRLELTYEHLPPDRLKPEVLPFHKERRPNSDWELVYGHALRLDRARDLIRFQGDSGLVADLAADPPLPLAWQKGLVRPRIGIRESIFVLGMQGVSRTLSSGNAFVRGTAHGSIEWSLTDFLALGIRDSFSLQDWRFADIDRLRSDRLENNFAVDLSYAREFTLMSLRLGVDSHFLEDFDGLDYNRGHAGVYGSHDKGGKYRLSGFFRLAAERNRDPRADLPDQDRYDGYVSGLWRFTPRKRIELSYLREEVAVSGLQSEFDSSYVDETTKVSYRQQLFGKVLGAQVFGEAGYKVKDEEHSVFTENNRTDRSVFGNLEVVF